MMMKHIMIAMDMLKTLFRAFVAVVLLNIAGVSSAQTADTSCVVPLPWGSSFEANHDTLNCWTVVHQCAGYPMAYYGYASDGEISLAMTSTSQQQPCMIATPRLAHRADSLHVSFHLTMAAGSGTLQVGLIDSVFVPLLSIPIESASLGMYEFYTDGFPSTDSLPVAFRVVDGRVCIDEVLVEAATLCRRPCMAWVDEVGIYGAVVSWSDCGGVALSYLVRQIDTATGDTVQLTAGDTSVAFFGMSPATTYAIQVAAVCAADTTGWLDVGMVTTEVACRQPLDATVAALTASAVGLRWNYDNGGINDPTGIHVTLADMYSGASPLSFSTSDSYLLADSLSTGHTYLATLRCVCQSDTSQPVTLTFTPVGDACTELSGTTVSQAFPVAVASPYSYSQMLYPSSVLSGMDSLYALAFRVVGDPVLYGSRTLDVYIGQTVDSTLAANHSTLAAHRVADGIAFAPDEAGWATVVFDYPLAVNPARSLLVTVVDRTGMPGGMLRFGTSYVSSGGTLHGTSSVMPFDPAMAIGVLSSTSAVADIQLFGNCADSSCHFPAAMVVASTTTSLSLRWTAVSGQTLVQYKVAGDDNWNVTTSMSDSCVLQGLNPGTRYILRLGIPSCGDGPEFEGMTACDIVSVPYHVDFAYGANPCWQGLQSLSDGGVRLGGMLVSPEIGQSVSTLQLRLSLGGAGYVYVGVCDADGENMQWVDTLDLGALVGEYLLYLDGYSGTSRRIALMGSSMAAVLRSVTIEQLDDCMPPRNLLVTGVTGSGATLSWQGSADSYEGCLVEDGTGHTLQWSSATGSMAFTGLSGNTSYHGYVHSRCGNDTSVTVAFSFTTGCQSVSYFPWHEGFESPTAPSQCWQLAYADPANQLSNPMTHAAGQAFEGVRSFRFSSYNYVPSDVYDQYLVSPRIEADDSIWLSFRYRKDNIEHEPFSVGFSTAGSALADFLWLGTEQPAAVGQWLEYSVGLPAATRYVAIHYMGMNSYYLYIDDLTLEGPGCGQPVITRVDEQSDAVTIGWAGSGDTSYVAITDGIWLGDAEGITVAGNEYTFSGLQSGRVLTVGVRSRCPDGRLSDWSVREVVTVDTLCLPPAALTVSDVDFTSASVSWQPVGWAQSWQLCLLSEGVLVATFPPVQVPHTILDGLEQGVTYSVMVRSLSGGIPGSWGDTVSFTTPLCATVDNVGFERVDFRTVSLTWQEAPVSSGLHRVEYGQHGFQRGSGTVVESTEMPLTIGNLEPEPDYDFYIQNYCQPGVLSDSAVMVTVPSALGIDDSPLSALHSPHVYPNPATSLLTIGDIAPGTTVEVLEVTGRTILSEFRIQNSEFRIDVSSYPAGTYFVRFTDSRRTAVAKFTVSRQ